MKKVLFIMSLLLAGTGLFAAKPDVYRIDVHNFSELVVVDGVPVDYHTHTDSAGYAVFRCAPEIASELIFSNVDDKLTVRTNADEKTLTGIPRVTLYSTALTKVENSGDSLVRVYIGAPVKEFKARQIDNGTLEIHNLTADNLDAAVTAGKGSLVVDGNVKSAKINNVSSGPVDAGDLKTANMSCFVFGSGNITCSPTEQLRIYGAGNGKIYYHGNPKIVKRGIGVKAIPASDKDTADNR